MPAQNIGMHHLHKRKRVHEKLEKYPHPEKFKRFIDKVIYVFAIVGPLMNLPQLYKIWGDKTAQGFLLFHG